MRKTHSRLRTTSALVMSLSFCAPAFVPANAETAPREPRFVAAESGSGDNFGNHTAEREINMDGFRITNMADPTSLTDAVNVQFLNFAIASAPGDNLGNHVATQSLNMGGNEIFNVADPSTESSAVNLRTLNAEIMTARDNLGNHVAEQHLNMSNFRVTNVADPSSDLDAVNLRSLIDRLSSVAGDDLGNHIAERDLDMAGFRIVNLEDPSDPLGGVNLRTLEDAIGDLRDDIIGLLPDPFVAGSGIMIDGSMISVNATVVRTSGNQSIGGNKTFTGVTSFSNQRVTAVADPSSGTDAANRRWVEAHVTNAISTMPVLSAGVGITISGDVISFDQVWGDGRYALRSRTITAGDGLAGGGSLASNRTLAVDGTVVRTSGDQLIEGEKTFADMMSMADNRIIMLADPSADQDAVNLRTMTAAINAITGGGSVSPVAAGDGISVSGNIVSVNNTVVRTTGNQTIGGNKTFTGVTSFSNQRVTAVADPTNATDAANRRWVEAQIAAATAGTVYTGGSGITVSGTVITVDGTVVRTTGNQTIGGNKTFTGVTSFSNQRVTAVADPTNATDAANRRWVQAQIASVPGQLVYTGGTGITVSGTVIDFDQSWGDGRYALRSRTITAGTGLTGGGNLQSNRTLAFDTTWGDGRYALRARTITAGTGLTGGGNLQANRTINFDTTWGDGRYALRSRTITAGDGLSGGGNLQSNRTINVDGTVVRTSGNQTIGGDKRFINRIDINNTNPTILLRDTDHRSAMIHVNNNTFYILRGSDINSSGWSRTGGHWPLTINLENNDARFGRNVTSQGMRVERSAGGFTGNLIVEGARASGANRSGTVRTQDLTSNRVWTFPNATGTVLLDSRTLTAGTGLTGGGTLQSNRTISFDTAWGDGRYALRSRTITAGDGLSGGGNLQSNRTINVDGTVVRTSGNQTIQGTKTFSGSLRSSRITVQGGVNRTGTLIMDGVVASGGNRSGTITTQALTANRTWTFPNATGTVVLDTRTITAGTGLTGGGNLQGNRTINLQNLQAGSTSQGAVWYNGTSRSGSRFYGGTTNPNGTGRLNYNGYLYATRFYSSAYFHFSDENLKENIVDLDPRDVGARLMDLRPVSYDWIENGEEAMGLIAQEVRTVFPGIVSEGEDGTLSVDYVQLISPMLAKMKDMDQSLEAERTRNAELTAMLGEMEDRLAAIEALLRD